MARDDDDSIDVKAEGRKLVERDKTKARDTADDEDYARKFRADKRNTKKSAQSREMYDILETEPRSPERRKLMRRDEYTIGTMADDKPRKRKSGVARKSTRKRVSTK